MKEYKYPITFKKISVITKKNIEIQKFMLNKYYDDKIFSPDQFYKQIIKL